MVRCCSRRGLAFPLNRFALALMSLFTGTVSILEQGNVKPIFNQFFLSSDVEGDPSFLKFFSTVVLRAAGTDVFEGSLKKASVRLRARGDVVDVRRLEDKVRPYCSPSHFQ